MDTEDTGPKSNRAMRRYLLLVLAVLVLLYLLPLPLGRSPLYDRLSPYFYARPLNYAFETAGENADVVLFGDSTAMLGVDPSQISAALGVKVLNLANSQPSLMVNDDLPLRRYLARNRPPRLIVFYFAPWDFDYGHTAFRPQFALDGEEVLLRWGTWREMLRFARREPLEALSFAPRFYSAVAEVSLHRRSHRGQQAQLAATRGHVDNPDPTLLAAPCRFPRELLDMVRFDWVRALGTRYATEYASAGTQVLFFVAPVPACGNADELLARGFDRLPAAPPRQLPPEDFSTGLAYLHLRPAAVPEATRNLIDAVRPLLGR